MKPNIITKMDESRITITQADVLSGKMDAAMKTHPYLVNDMRRRYKEDFVDEKNGEIIPIDRYDIIVKRGESILAGDNIAQMRFFAGCNELADFILSNQQRTGVPIQNNNMTVWSVSATVIPDDGKPFKVTYLLYACSVEQAIDIVTDYLETHQRGYFEFYGIKKYHNCHIITNNIVELDKATNDEQENVINPYYIIAMSINGKYGGDDVIDAMSFLVQSENATAAHDKIQAYVAKACADNIENGIDPDDKLALRFIALPDTLVLKTLSANIVHCTDVLDVDFSLAYINRNGNE